jgi:hypothetical protein
MVAWADVSPGGLDAHSGPAQTINSSGTAMRSFCADCGSGLFYGNAGVLPGLVDVQSATLNDPGALAPTMQFQTAERLAWMRHLHEFPERYPSLSLGSSD